MINRVASYSAQDIGVSRPLQSGCKIASTFEERLQSFQLVYDNYVESRLIEPNCHEMRVTPYHLLQTTSIFVAIERGEVVATVSLVGDGPLGIPMESIYAEEVEQQRQCGHAFGEVSCLAVKDDVSFRRFLPVFTQLMRLMMQHARYCGLDRLLIAVHPRHARFYQRTCGFVSFGGEKHYPSVRNNPAVACYADFAEMERDHPLCYNPMFGGPIPERELALQPMGLDEIVLFRPAVESADCGASLLV